MLENDIGEQWNLLEMTDEILSLQVTDDSQCGNGFLTERKLIVRSQWQEIVESRKEGKNYPQQNFRFKILLRQTFAEKERETIYKNFSVNYLK